MYWQREFLRQGEAWANGGTLKLDLPKVGLLGSIMVHARRAGVTDAFNAALKWRLIDYISKVEVLANGSDIVKSFSGEVAKGLTIFDGGGGPLRSRCKRRPPGLCGRCRALFLHHLRAHPVRQAAPGLGC